MTTEQLFTMFPRGCRLIIDPIFPREGQYKVGYEYVCWARGECRRLRYLPGSGSYYDLNEALVQAWWSLQSRWTGYSRSASVLQDAMSCM